METDILKCLQSRLDLQENREFGQNPRRYRHCNCREFIYDESRSLEIYF